MMKPGAFHALTDPFFLCKPNGEVRGADETPCEIGELIFSLVRLERPAVVVEIGSHQGITSAWIMAALDELYCGHLYAYEVNESHRQKWRDNMKSLWPDGGAPGSVHHENILDSECPIYADLAFIDLHPKSLYVAAYEKLEIPKGGIVLAHDLTLHGEKRNNVNDGVHALYDQLMKDGYNVFPVAGGRGLIMARKGLPS